jgi:hypothetical protein
LLNPDEKERERRRRRNKRRNERRRNQTREIRARGDLPPGDPDYHKVRTSPASSFGSPSDLTSSDLSLVRQAMRANWHIPPEFMQAFPAILAARAVSGDTDLNFVLRIVNLLRQMDETNIKRLSLLLKSHDPSSQPRQSEPTQSDDSPNAKLAHDLLLDYLTRQSLDENPPTS